MLGVAVFAGDRAVRFPEQVPSGGYFPSGCLSNFSGSQQKPSAAEPPTLLKDVDYLLSVVIFLNTFTF